MGGVKKGGQGVGMKLGTLWEGAWKFCGCLRRTTVRLGERRERAKGRKFREIIKVPGIITSESNRKGTQQGRSGDSAPEIHTAGRAVGCVGMGQQCWQSQCAGARLTYVGRLKVTLAVSEEEFSAVVLVLLAGMAAPGGGGGMLG